MLAFVLSGASMLGPLWAESLPKIEYMSIPAGAFVPTSEEGTYRRNSAGRLMVPKGSLDSTFVAGVSLPNGATIHSLSAHFVDGTSSSEVVLSLNALRRNLDNHLTPVETVKLAKVLSNGEARLVTLTDDVIQTGWGFNPVDNRNVTYNLKLSLLPGPSFFGVTIGFAPKHLSD